MKLAKAFATNHQTWAVMSAIGTFGGFVVALYLILFPGCKGADCDKQQPLPPASDEASLLIPGGSAGGGNTTFFRLLSEGETAYKSGDFDKADDRFNQAVSRIGQDNPSIAAQAEAYWWRGVARHANGRVQEAITDYKRAFDNSMEKDMLAANIGQAYFDIERWEDAEDWLAIAVYDYLNSDTGVLADLAYAQFQTRNFQGCLDSYADAVSQLSPTSDKWHAYLGNRALCGEALGFYEDALYDVNFALSKNGPYAAALNQHRQRLISECGAACR